jgi:membrane protease YdiL (CAAX protease family)
MIAAARLRQTLDAKLGKNTPESVASLAAETPHGPRQHRTTEEIAAAARLRNTLDERLGRTRSRSRRVAAVQRVDHRTLNAVSARRTPPRGGVLATLTVPVRRESSPEETPRHRWGLASFLLVQPLLLVSLTLSGPPEQGGPAAMLWLMAPTVLAATIAVLITVYRGNGPVTDLRLTFSWSDLRAGLKLGTAGVVVGYVVTLLWMRFVDASPPGLAGLGSPANFTVVQGIVLFVYLWLVLPVCEEIIYRGLLWGGFERHQWNRLLVFVLTTAVYTVNHLDRVIPVIVLYGLVTGLARLVTRRLLASVVAHQVINFLPALAVLLASVGAIPW